MRICIDATLLGVKTLDRGGIYRYLSELIETLAAIDKKNDYTIFVNFFRSENLPVFNEFKKRLRAGDNFRVRLSRFPPRLRSIFEPPLELLAGRFDVFHNGFDYLPPMLFGKGIATVNDLRYMEDIDRSVDAEWIEVLRRLSPEPEFHIRDCRARGGLFEELRSSIKKTVKRASAIITISEFTKSKLTGLLGVDENRVTVIPLAADKSFRPMKSEEVRPVLKKFGISKPYIFYSGKYDPLKNLLRLVEAFSMVRPAHDVKLVFAGPINWFYYIVMDKVKELGLAHDFIATGLVTDEELAALYSGASVFAFPSLYEGFGIPPLEAMSCGTPVVASRECSIPEVVGDAACFVDAESGSDIARGLMECMEDKGLRQELIGRGFRRVKNFTWKRTAEKTLEVYQSV